MQGSNDIGKVHMFTIFQWFPVGIIESGALRLVSSSTVILLAVAVIIQLSMILMIAKGI